MQGETSTRNRIPAEKSCRYPRRPVWGEAGTCWEGLSPFTNQPPSVRFLGVQKRLKSALWRERRWRVEREASDLKQKLQSSRGAPVSSTPTLCLPSASPHAHPPYPSQLGAHIVDHCSEPGELGKRRTKQPQRRSPEQIRGGCQAPASPLSALRSASPTPPLRLPSEPAVITLG